MILVLGLLGSSSLLDPLLLLSFEGFPLGILLLSFVRGGTLPRVLPALGAVIQQTVRREKFVYLFEIIEHLASGIHVPVLLHEPPPGPDRPHRRTRIARCRYNSPPHPPPPPPKYPRTDRSTASQTPPYMILKKQFKFEILNYLPFGTEKLSIPKQKQAYERELQNSLL